MKKNAPKKKDLSGTIESSPISASSADQVIAHSSSNCLDETNLWDSTFNAVEDAISIIDSNQRIVRYNKAMQTFSENENLIGMHCYRVIHGTEYPHSKCPFRKMMQTGKRENAEVQEGDQWLHVTVDPLFDPDKQLTGAVHIIRNITGRKNAEDLLKANYSLLRTAGRTAKFGGWKLNLSKKKVTWSDEVAAIHEMPAGYSPSLAEGINFYAPEWRDKITNAINSCAELGTPFDLELELITANGNRIWVRSTGEAVRDKIGNIAKIRGSFQDITERKQIRQLILENETNARAIMESTSDSMLLLQKDGTIIDNNEGHASRLGFARKDLLGKKIYDYLPKDVGEKRKELIDLAISTGVTQYGEDVRAERSIEYSIHPIFDRNKITDRVAIFARDITESKNNLEALKKNEELLSLFMKHSPIYSFIKEVTPTESRVLRASENYTDMIGVSGSDMAGKTMYELFPLEFAKKITADDWVISSGGNPLTLNEELNGRYYITIKFPITQNGKNLLAGYTIDVTDQKLAEQCLLKNESHLRELNATKDKFFSIIAHDLKSPFNSIIGFSNLLIRQIEEKDYAAIERYASIIQNSSQQAMDLLMNLLEWSRAQTGHIVFTPEKIDFADSINRATELFFAMAQQKSITIYLETSVNLSFFADKAMINTILRNLISNAIKFTNVGGEIIISAKQTLNDLVVSVSDNGIGMDEETTSKLFRIDQNQSTLGTEKEKGTGLGLLLCKEFIEKHSGRIWVESEPGKGSKFHFSIPNRISANSSF